jgi:UDP-N-acetylglucosamine 2-epimerase (non-hydrolysing)
MHVLHVVGARPNFIKAGPVMRALAARKGVRQTLVHTGQHYDAAMSEVFFKQLDIPRPDINLEVGSGSHAFQTAGVMSLFEKVVMEQKPDLVLVYGDVNSTVAGAIVCAKMMIPVGHVEAGLRSFDRTMPEEINRILTDQVADLLFTPSPDGNENLKREGIPPERVHLVGNVMIDTLMRLVPRADRKWKHGKLTLQGQALEQVKYAVVTLHRPSNVDDPQTLRSLMGTLLDISRRIPVVFPIHPRTRQRLEAIDFQPGDSMLRLLEPLGYLEFLALQRHALLMITDSGGIQEETTYLSVPCLTVRETTERPITVTMGTNLLVGHDMDRLRKQVEEILAGNKKRGRMIPLWDGKASERIAEVILSTC